MGNKKRASYVIPKVAKNSVFKMPPARPDALNSIEFKKNFQKTLKRGNYRKKIEMPGSFDEEDKFDSFRHFS